MRAGWCNGLESGKHGDTVRDTGVFASTGAGSASLNVAVKDRVLDEGEEEEDGSVEVAEAEEEELADCVDSLLLDEDGCPQSSGRVAMVDKETVLA